DTRIRNAGLEVEVCLKLLDSPKPSRKKESSHPVTSSIQSSPARAGATDPSELLPELPRPTLPKALKAQPRPLVGWAESSRPTLTDQAATRFWWASETRPTLRHYDGSGNST